MGKRSSVRQVQGGQQKITANGKQAAVATYPGTNTPITGQDPYSIIQRFEGYRPEEIKSVAAVGPQEMQETLAQRKSGLAGYQAPELEAMRAQMAAGQQAGQQQAQFGAGLLGLGSDLMGKYYGGQTAAYAPFATAIDTSSGLESLAQQPMTLGTQIGAKTTASAAEAGRLLGQGMLNSATTQAPANAFSYSGNLFSQAANNPQLQAAILKAFST
jgi:hypothetical protein